MENGADNERSAMERACLVGKRALIAEDDPKGRRLIAGTLREMGLDVMEVEDGGRMLVAMTAEYKGDRPESLALIVTDVRMPVLTGLEVFKGFRSANWSTRTIVVTSIETRAVLDAGARLDAVLLKKPLDMPLFVDTVRRLLVAPRRPLARCRWSGVGSEKLEELGHTEDRG
jgi:CheY-like chemotaxis protein